MTSRSVSAVSTGGSSVLIGQWTLSQQVVDPNHVGSCTRTILKFANDAWGYVQDGKFNQFPVSSYDMIDGNHVIVRTLPADEAFTVDDNNTIEGAELMTKCIYTRSS